MNSFFVPQLGSQIYTMASMTSQVSLQADQQGSYEGLSAQFSGEGFSDMRFVVRAVAPDAFAKWVDDTQATGTALDRAAYNELAKPSKNVPPGTYNKVDPKLFDDVVAGDVSRPGIEGGRGGQDSPPTAKKEP